MCFKSEVDEEKDFYEKREITRIVTTTGNSPTTAAKHTPNLSGDSSNDEVDLKSIIRSATHTTVPSSVPSTAASSRVATPGLERHLSISGAYFMDTQPEPLANLLVPTWDFGATAFQSRVTSPIDEGEGYSSGFYVEPANPQTSADENDDGGLEQPAGDTHTTTDVTGNSQLIWHTVAVPEIPITVRPQLEQQDELGANCKPKKPNAHLCDIPGELRNQIYSYLDFYDGVVCLHCPRAQGATDYERMHKPALTRVCSKLRDETFRLYYSTNKFETTCCWASGKTSCFAEHGGNGLLSQEWLASIYEFWPDLRDIKLRLPGWNTWTRFRLREFGDPSTGAFDLVVTAGEPISREREQLLRLLVNSFFEDDCRLSSIWTGEDLALLLRDLPRVVERVTATARVATHLLPPVKSPSTRWDAQEGGFGVVFSGPTNVQTVQANTGVWYMGEVLDWVAIVQDVQSVVSDVDFEGALLVAKDAPRAPPNGLAFESQEAEERYAQLLSQF